MIREMLAAPTEEKLHKEVIKYKKKHEGAVVKTAYRSGIRQDWIAIMNRPRKDKP